VRELKMTLEDRLIDFLRCRKDELICADSRRLGELEWVQSTLAFVKKYREQENKKANTVIGKGLPVSRTKKFTFCPYCGEQL